jgi:UDP-N-acetylglucosamine diphosphorylase / glucose-1-phosphate thymidylyltransferase / UDP-N-acetylgalactosamine diphosphorylase / glucosamine-1-phosphate N-acetyltransferase / galactosamine-1-phosphate N-acetyltransferase
MQVIFYEDNLVSGLFPVTLARPAFDIRSGGYTLFEAIKHIFSNATFYGKVREGVKDVSGISDFNSISDTSGPYLVLNARLAPSLSFLKDVFEMIGRGSAEHTFLVKGEVAGVFAHKISDEQIKNLSNFTVGEKHEIIGSIFSHPEDMVFFNRENLGTNLQIASKSMRSKKRGLSIASFSVLKGPLFIGDNSFVKEFSVLENSTIGPVCKVGGEIEASIIDAYSNKQHTGSLGDSYIGRWVNIGGGTTVSNLKNTYSTISVGGRDTFSQFLGTIVGDYAKIGSNTSIFPGKVVGVSSHVYSTVIEDVPSFSSYVRAGVFFELPVVMAEKIQKAMSTRRMINYTDKDTELFNKMFEETKEERNNKNVSKAKLTF